MRAVGEKELLARARSEWKKGRLAEAEILLRELVIGRPGWALGVAALAHLMAERGKVPDATRLLARARKAKLEHPALLVVEGELRLVQRRPAAAARWFRRAQKLGAPVKVVRAGLSRVELQNAEALIALGRKDEAAFALKRATDLDPSYASPKEALKRLFAKRTVRR
jgi:tetratricopeptide (TPR) repeat protein